MSENMNIDINTKEGREAFMQQLESVNTGIFRAYATRYFEELMRALDQKDEEVAQAECKRQDALNERDVARAVRDVCKQERDEARVELAEERELRKALEESLAAEQAEVARLTKLTEARCWDCQNGEVSTVGGAPVWCEKDAQWRSGTDRCEHFEKREEDGC